VFCREKEKIPFISFFILLSAEIAIEIAAQICYAYN